MLALKDGLQLAWLLGYKYVHCEVDCLDLLETINNISNLDMELHMHKDIVVRLKHLLQRTWEVTFDLINRNANGLTYILAAKGARF
uniref:RNase H type-1 domain-containing protein n=1 Tax=Cajanus cajan TaxID=3821 RepID=A0A151RB58_CAJCA|nr:hypothetical protein KK1_038955 [Cajanus cajan]